MTIHGKVPNETSKQNAAAAVRKLDGVKDVKNLLQVVPDSTKENVEVVKHLFAAWNRDDHLRQHALLMDRAGTWTLSPSYDLSFSHGMGGEHPHFRPAVTLGRDD